MGAACFLVQEVARLSRQEPVLTLIMYKFPSYFRILALFILCCFYYKEPFPYFPVLKTIFKGAAAEMLCIKYVTQENIPGNKPARREIRKNSTRFVCPEKINNA